MKTRFMRPLIFAILLTAVTALAVTAGCGDQTSGSEEEQVSMPDPCELVSKSDIEGIMGEPVQAAQYQEVAGGKSCSYTSVAQPPRVAKMTIIPGCMMSDYSDYAGDGEPVKGIGMHAAWNNSELVIHSHGSSCLIISAGGPPRGTDDDQAAQDNALTVAKQIIAKTEGSSS